MTTQTTQALPKPWVWCSKTADDKPNFGKGWVFSPFEQSDAPLPLFTAAQLQEFAAARDARIAELEAELAALKAPTANSGSLPEMKQINDLPATPWYPDDSGEWVEVPEDLMEMPAGLSPSETVEVLLKCERDAKAAGFVEDFASTWKWDTSVKGDGRIVAYKVVKP